MRTRTIDGPPAGGREVPATGALAVRSVTKRFGPVVAVDDVSLEFPAGSFVGILGPSGCGKTTLFRVISGLEQPDSGQVLIDEQDITAWPPERRPFNMVFQRYALFPHLSVFDNVAFGLTTERASRPPRDEISRRVGEMLELVGLSGYERRYPGQLSGGQQQRVAVARALIRRPRVLLLDEPMAALDRNIRHQVREELLRIHAEIGTTFVLVTHDQDEALSISGIVALMNQGRIEQLADPETLYRRPASLFAARFVGAGSFLAARIVGRAGENVEVEVAGLRFAAADGGVGSAATAQVLMRPEDLEVTAPGEGRLDGRVETSAFFGSYYEIRVATPLGLVRCRTRTGTAPGAAIGIGWSDVAGIAYADETAPPAASPAGL